MKPFVFEIQSGDIDFSSLKFGVSKLYSVENTSLTIRVTDDRQSCLDKLFETTPAIPDEIYSLGGEDFKRAVLLYKVKALCYHLGYLKDYVPIIREYVTKYGVIKGLEETLGQLSGIGFEAQIILAACSSLVSQYQSKVQTYAGLDLTLDEINELERVKEARRKINNGYTTKVASNDYARLSIKEQSELLKHREIELASVSTTLYNIVSMGASFLSSSARLSLKLDPKLSVDELLTKFRKSEVGKFRSAKANYVLPKSVS